mmetsp:Transcript_26749/g.41354  ORF Transcript_26749/g.41354 Transcript_26749/m.41354 type:complete len:121 (-) Transcript_26749:21-383(-)
MVPLVPSISMEGEAHSSRGTRRKPPCSMVPLEKIRFRISLVAYTAMVVYANAARRVRAVIILRNTLQLPWTTAASFVSVILEKGNLFRIYYIGQNLGEGRLGKYIRYQEDDITLNVIQNG